VLLAPVVEANVRALRERDSPGLRRYTEAAGLLIGRDDATVKDAVDRLRGRSPRLTCCPWRRWPAVGAVGRGRREGSALEQHAGQPGTALRGGARRGAVGSVVIADPVRDLSMSTLDDA
jgi:hypothetical protein